MRRILAVTAAGLALTGCYHVSVVTGAPPAPTVIDKEWQNSFIFGLIPPPPIETKGTCASGVSRVETEHSFLNGLAAALTGSLYTPMHARITCATGPVPR